MTDRRVRRSSGVLISTDRWIWIGLALIVLTCAAAAISRSGLAGDLTAILAVAGLSLAVAALVWRDWRLGTRGVSLTAVYVETRINRFGHESYGEAVYEYEHGGRRFRASGRHWFNRRRPMPKAVNVVIDPAHPWLVRILWH